MTAGQRWSRLLCAVLFVAGCDRQSQPDVGFINVYRDNGTKPECRIVTRDYEIRFNAAEDGVCYMPAIVRR